MRFVTLNDRKCILDKENGATYCFINIRDMRNCCKLLTQLDDERKSLNQDLNKQFLLGSNGYNPFRDFEHRNKKALNGDGFLMFLKEKDSGIKEKRKQVKKYFLNFFNFILKFS